MPGKYNWAGKLMLLTTLLISVTGTVFAAQDVKVTLRPSGQMQMAGRLGDERVIATGSVSVTRSSVDDNIVVWLNALQDGARGGRYIITGKNNENNKLRVKLKAEDSHSDNNSGGIVFTGDRLIRTFEIVADGEQKVTSDVYPINLQTGIETSS